MWPRKKTEALGDYEILELLSEGGQARVYKVRHRALDEHFVVKQLRPDTERREEMQQRFLREGRFLRRSRHPNLPLLQDLRIADDGDVYIVMEFIEGLTVEEILANRQLLSVGTVLEIGRGVLGALAHIHSEGYVHRDVSPDNIMVRLEAAEPVVKLIDLGIAKGCESTSLTQQDRLLGKFRYASPEQHDPVRFGEVSPTADLYSLGLVLYELLTLRYAYSGGNSFNELYRCHTGAEPIPFEHSDPQLRVPPRIRKAILRALAKQPTARWSTATEFSAELELPPEQVDFDPQEDLARVSGITRRPRSLGKVHNSDQVRFDDLFRSSSAKPPVERERDRDAAALLRAAKGLLDNDRVDEAEEAVRNVLAHWPDHPEATALLSQCSRARKLDAKLAALEHELRDHLGRQEVTAAERKLASNIDELGANPGFEQLRREVDDARQRQRIAAIAERLASVRRTLAAEPHAGQLEIAESSLAVVQRELSRAPTPADLQRETEEVAALLAARLDLEQRCRNIEASLDDDRLDDAQRQLEATRAAHASNRHLDQLDARIAAARREQEVTTALSTATALAEHGQLTLAISSLENAILRLGEDPRLVEPLARLRSEHETAERNAAAEKLLRELEAQVRNALATGNIERAEEAIRKASADDSFTLDWQHLLAEVQDARQRQKRERELITVLERAAAVEADDPAAATDILAVAGRELGSDQRLESALARARASAEARAAREARERAIEAAIERATAALQRDTPAEALSVLERTSHELGDDPRLLAALVDARARWERAEAENQRNIAVEQALYDASAQLAADRPEQAAETAAAALRELGEDARLARLHERCLAAVQERRSELVRRSIAEADGMMQTGAIDGALGILANLDRDIGRDPTAASLRNEIAASRRRCVEHGAAILRQLLGERDVEGAAALVSAVTPWIDSAVVGEWQQQIADATRARANSRELEHDGSTANDAATSATVIFEPVTRPLSTVEPPSTPDAGDRTVITAQRPAIPPPPEQPPSPGDAPPEPPESEVPIMSTPPAEPSPHPGSPAVLPSSQPSTRLPKVAIVVVIAVVLLLAALITPKILRLIWPPDLPLVVAPPGTLQIRAFPWADVEVQSLDEPDRGPILLQAPGAARLPAGRYRVTLRSADGAAETRDVLVESDSTATLVHSFEGINGQQLVERLGRVLGSGEPGR